MVLRVRWWGIRELIGICSFLLHNKTKHFIKVNVSLYQRWRTSLSP